MRPAFQTEGFLKYKNRLNNEKFNRLVACVESLNNVFTNETYLGDGFCIGHSYFCNQDEVTNQWLEEIVEYELIPLLKEYWFDDAAKVREWSDHLRGAIR
jgi:5-methylcytosine-specific restriction protein B